VWRYLISLVLLLLCTSHASAPIVRQPSYWRLLNRNGRWSFVSPTGDPLFLMTVNHVQPQQIAILGPGYRSSDFDGDLNKWARRTQLRIKAMGFDGVGAWSNEAIYPYVPHGIQLHILDSIPDIAAADWGDRVEMLVRKNVRPQDQGLIGYWLDNELDWIHLSPYADKYFQTTSKLVRKYDPNHAILGVRFNHPPPDDVLLASRGCVDAHSFNIYADNPKKWNPQFERVYRFVGVPSQISEFSFCADENRSGNKNRKAFGGRVSTQLQRKQLFESTITDWNSNPLIVGADFFQWNDEPPGGRIKDGEDCNYGLVDIRDVAYDLKVAVNRGRD
jgi:hypothetical protein